MHMRPHPILIATALTAAPTVVLLAQALGPDFLRKPSSEAVRVMTWNIGSRSVFPKDDVAVDVGGVGRPAQFARVMRALQPDVVCLQEAESVAGRAASLFDQILPLGTDVRWQEHTVLGNTIMSRFGLNARAEQRFDRGGQPRGQAIALVNLPDASYARDLYVLCVHFQSRGGDENVRLRQQEADRIVRWTRDAKSPGGAIDLPDSTPFVILGDMNVVGTPVTFVDSMLNGSVADTAAFGPAIRMDWDGSAISDALPRHNGAGTDVYTIRNDLGPFPPGALDRVLYSDSVLQVVDFVLRKEGVR